MPFLQPTPTDFDPDRWEALPYPERLRVACADWAQNGYGAPLVVYLAYLVKFGAYVAGWVFFCGFTPGLGDWQNPGAWILDPVAFQKAVLWSMAWEGLGLGGGSGPLTGRYWPPMGGALHFLRPGTSKLPLFRGLPLLGRSRRGWLEVLLYAAHYLCLFRALAAPEITPALVWPSILLLPLLGLADRCIFLAARGEHYYVTLVCFLCMDPARFGDTWIAGAQAVQLAVWFWAGVSKLTPNFPSVVCVMTSNSPFMRLRALRRAMYRKYPEDLRPSRLAEWLAHGGAVVELCFPLLLAFSDGGWSTLVGLALMLSFHLFITSNFPMAVPIEWNIHVVYGAFFLFHTHAGVSPLSVASPWLVVFLLVMLVALPLLGNLAPARLSFLLSMRYYAGNWPFSIWFFRKQGEQVRRLDARFVKSSGWLRDQLERFMDAREVTAMMARLQSFRAMHLQGRTVQALMPRVVSSIDDYEYVDGEVVAGMVLGWNFGDGHLHDEKLLALVQERCGFEEGDLRCLFVESQPLLGDSYHWRIHDARTGLLGSGHLKVADMKRLQPWPEPTAPVSSPPEVG